jgi:hypothetical protein
VSNSEYIVYIYALLRPILTLGSLLMVGTLKFAIVPACLLDATCAPAYAAGSALKVLETGRIDWRPLEELIFIFTEKLLVRCGQLNYLYQKLSSCVTMVAVALPHLTAVGRKAEKANTWTEP